MASFSSSLNSAANAFVADFYKPLRPNHSERFYLYLSKWMTSFWGVAKVTVALISIPLLSRQSVVVQVLSVAAVTTGIIMGLFILGSQRYPVRSGPAIVGLIVGFIASASLWLATLFKHPVLAWPWFAPVGTLTTVAVALGVNAIGTVHGQPDD